MKTISMYTRQGKSFYFFGVFLLSLQYSTTRVSSVHPGGRYDMIGQAVMANKKQCSRLCWYRLLCSSFSFRTGPGSSGEEANCYLHTETVSTAGAAPEEGWTEYPVSAAGITNGCRDRSCSNSEVCVPRASSGPPQHQYACLPWPAQCGDPDPVPRGDVNQTGTFQDDEARVTCHEGCIASPKGVDMKMVCLVTSRWTELAGTCQRYIFSGELIRNTYNLPWLLQHNSIICVKGTMNAVDISAITVNLKQQQQNSDFAIHYSFRHLDLYPTDEGIRWTMRDNGVYKPSQRLGSMPINPGESFNFTIQLLTDSLQLVINGDHKFNINVDDIRDIANNLLDASLTYQLQIFGTVELTYVDLITGCEQ